MILPIGRDSVVLLGEARNSASSKGGTGDGGGEAKMEKLTMDEAGSRGLETEATPERQDDNNLWGMSVSTVGTGTTVGVGASVDACDKVPLKSVATRGMSCSVAAATYVGLGLV